MILIFMFISVKREGEKEAKSYWFYWEEFLKNKPHLQILSLFL